MGERECVACRVSFRITPSGILNQRIACASCDGDIFTAHLCSDCRAKVQQKEPVSHYWHESGLASAFASLWR